MSTDAGDTVVVALSAITVELDATLGPALLDLPDALHPHRKSVRRLRSTLAAYRPFFDTEAVRALRDDYRSWGRELGEVRDAEVRVATAAAYLADADDAERALGAALVEQVRAQHHREQLRLARRGVTVAAQRRRHDLSRFLESPPRRAKGERAAKKAIRKRLVKEGQRVLRRAEAVELAGQVDLEGHGDMAPLHEVRKAARRLRYAAEAVVAPPVSMFGTKAVTLAAAAERIHDVLGDHRDETAFALRAEAAGAPGTAARARADADARLAQLPAALDDLRTALNAFA